MTELSIPVLALAIALLRVVDVTFGTLRTIAVVNSRAVLSVVFGFLEVLVWLLAASQVLGRVDDSPVLMLAFAGGYAAGNAVGILVERRLALGHCMVRIISPERGAEVALALRAMGQRVTTIEGEGRDGPRTLVYAVCARRDLGDLMRRAQEIDPALFYVVEPVSQSSRVVPLARSAVTPGAELPAHADHRPRLFPLRLGWQLSRAWHRTPPG